VFCSAPGEEEQLVDRINAFVAEVHDRMPVLLERKQFDTWMKGSVDEATALMKPAGRGRVEQVAGVKAGQQF
jgi:putative SOS response-associated peptidase YedK